MPYWSMNAMRSSLPVVVCLLGCAPQVSAEPAIERQAELRHLLVHDCGSCHGLTMRGGLGPALTPAALSGKSPELLAATILDGRDGTAMPPWRGIIDEHEGRWLVRELLQGVRQP